MLEKAYWKHLSKHAQIEEDKLREPLEANPDSLPDTATPWLPRWTEVQKEKLAAIEGSFERLTDIQRRIIVLIYTENLTQIAIAKRLKISQQNVSKQLNVARKVIKNFFLENRGNGAI